MTPLYALWDFTGEYGSYMLQWTHDFDGKPLVTIEQAQRMIDKIGSPTMGIESLTDGM